MSRSFGQKANFHIKLFFFARPFDVTSRRVYSSYWSHSSISKQNLKKKRKKHTINVWRSTKNAFGKNDCQDWIRWARCFLFMVTDQDIQVSVGFVYVAAFVTGLSMVLFRAFFSLYLSLSPHSRPLPQDSLLKLPFCWMKKMTTKQKWG